MNKKIFGVIITIIIIIALIVGMVNFLNFVSSSTQPTSIPTVTQPAIISPTPMLSMSPTPSLIPTFLPGPTVSPDLMEYRSCRFGNCSSSKFSCY